MYLDFLFWIVDHAKAIYWLFQFLLFNIKNMRFVYIPKILCNVLSLRISRSFEIHFTKILAPIFR
jgi:uncharacterized protein with PQ loop repeat